MNETNTLDDLDDDNRSDTEAAGSDNSGDSVSVLDSVGAMADKDVERLRLRADVDAFLAHGGKIIEVPTNVIGDPPKKPVSSYGGQAL